MRKTNELILLGTMLESVEWSFKTCCRSILHGADPGMKELNLQLNDANMSFNIVANGFSDAIVLFNNIYDSQISGMNTFGSVLFDTPAIVKIFSSPLKSV